MAVDGKALKLLRTRTGWKATGFAAEAGISLQYLCDIERGDRSLKRNPGLIKRFAEVLDVPVSMISLRATGEDAA